MSALPTYVRFVTAVLVCRCPNCNFPVVLPDRPELKVLPFKFTCLMCETLSTHLRENVLEDEDLIPVPGTIRKLKLLTDDLKDRVAYKELGLVLDSKCLWRLEIKCPESPETTEVHTVPPTGKRDLEAIVGIVCRGRIGSGWPEIRTMVPRTQYDFSRPPWLFRTPEGFEGWPTT